MQNEVKNDKIISDDRRKYIYIAKGIAIFLMLYGHCIQYCTAGSDMDFFENGVFKTIYAFHMPLFMLISGYLFRFSFEKYNVKELLTRRVQSMVQPIVFCSIFSFLITDVAFGVVTGELAGIWDGGWLANLPSLWFLWSVLSATLAVTLVCKLVRSIYLKIPLLGLMVIFVAFFPNASENVFMYPFFLLGFCFARYENKLPLWVYRLRYLSLILFPVMICFCGETHFVQASSPASSSRSFWEIAWGMGGRWGIGLAGSVFVLTLLDLVYQKFNRVVLGRVFLGGLACLGKKSLQIYAVSVPLLSSLLSFAFPILIQLLGGENPFAGNVLVYNFVFTPSLALAYAFGLYFVVYLLEKAKLSRLMFGR